MYVWCSIVIDVTMCQVVLYDIENSLCWKIVHSKRNCFLVLSIYCPYLSFRSSVICAFVMVGFVHKLLEIFLSICGFITHLFMLSNVLARSSLLFLATVSKYNFRCLIGPLYGWLSSLHHQYGVEWAFSCAWVGMSFSESILLPSFANLLASSLPMMLVCALTLCRVVVATWSFSNLTIKASMVLSGWLFCYVGCFIWMFMRYRELRLSQKICIGSWGNSWLRMSSVWYMANISTLRMFCRPINLLDIFILRSGFWMLYLALASSHMLSESLLGGVNDSSI